MASHIHTHDPIQPSYFVLDAQTRLWAYQENINVIICGIPSKSLVSVIWPQSITWTSNAELSLTLMSAYMGKL